MKDDLIRRSDVLKKTVWMETNVPTRVAPLQTEVVLVEDVRSIPAVDAVERGVFEQVAWERDVAIEQLKAIGKGLGEKMDDVAKVVRCPSCLYNTDDEYHECIYFGIRIPDDAEFFCKYGKRKEEEHNG